MSDIRGIEKHADLQRQMEHELSRLKASSCPRDCSERTAIHNKYAFLVHQREERKATNRKVPSARFS